MTSLTNHATWLAGYIPDLPTPFDESGAIDLAAFERLCERQIEAGVSAVVVGETIGETSTLTPGEHETISAPRSRSRAAGFASLPAQDPIRPARPSNWPAAPKPPAPTRCFRSCPITTSRCNQASTHIFRRWPARPRCPSSCTTFPPEPSASCPTKRWRGSPHRSSSSDCGMAPAMLRARCGCGRCCRTGSG